jgi:hypothetical protein
VPLPTPEGFQRFVYAVKFLCGIQAECDCHCGPLRPGTYATEINIHNGLDFEVKIVKHVIPLVFAGAVSGREPRFAGRKASDRIVLPPHTATMDDCCRLLELLLGAPAGSNVPLTSGFLESMSDRPITVTAAYTVTDPKSGSISMDIEQIQGRVDRPGRIDERPKEPVDRTSKPPERPSQPPERPSQPPERPSQPPERPSQPPDRPSEPPNRPTHGHHH